MIDGGSWLQVGSAWDVCGNSPRRCIPASGSGQVLDALLCFLAAELPVTLIFSGKHSHSPADTSYSGQVGVPLWVFFRFGDQM